MIQITIFASEYVSLYCVRILIVRDQILTHICHYKDAWETSRFVIYSVYINLNLVFA